MRLLIDFDGTVADLQTPWAHWHDSVCGCCLLLEVGHYDWGPACRQGWDLLQRFLQQDGIYEGVLPFPGVLKAVQSLAKRHEVVIVSHISQNVAPKTYSEKVRWLDKRLPGIPFWGVTRKESLGNYDMLIDDYPAILRRVPRGILVPRPWNRWERAGLKVLDLMEVCDAW